MYYKIFKSVCKDLKLDYYYGDNWLINYKSLSHDNPAVYMFPIIENLNDYNEQSQVREIEVVFSILKKVSSEDFINPDSDKNYEHISEMKKKLLDFLYSLRDYEYKGVPIFRNGTWFIKITEGSKIKLNDYLMGASCEMRVKVLNLDNICKPIPDNDE